jgi:hypothetical protein
VATTASPSPSPTAEPEDFTEQWCDATAAFRRVVNELPELHTDPDPQLVAEAEGVESDLNQLAEDLDAGGLDELAGHVGALSAAAGDLAEALNTTYTSEADTLKNALDDQNGAMDKVNAALDDFPRNQFGTC